VEQFSILIEDLNFQIAENVPLLLVVGDKGIGRPGLAEKCLVPLWPSAISVEILNCWRPFDDGCVFLHQIGLQASERRHVVDDPDTPPVGCENQIRLPRMYYQVSHCHCGKVAAFVLPPALTTIGRDPETEFRAEEEQVGI